MRHNITIFLIISSLLVLFSACSTTKYVPKDKLLLKKNSIIVNSKVYKKDNLYPFLIQKPNSKVLGLFPFPLYFYDWANKDYEKKWDNKIKKYADSSHFFTKILSLKQTVGYANFRKNLNKWFLKNGEAPVILDEHKTNRTLRNLQQYYLGEGFFKASVNYSIDTISENTSHVIYKIETKKPYFIDSITYHITSPVLDSLYQRNAVTSFIKEGQQFKRKNFEDEADRLTSLFRNSGIYHFSKFSINFKDIDSTRSDFKTNVILDISDRLMDAGDSISHIPYQISYIKKVKIYTDYSYLKRNDFISDSINYKGINFYAYDNIAYKPKFLSRSIFIKPGDIYSDFNNELTRKHLKKLNNFKAIRINYEEIKPNELIAHILLTPLKRYSLKLETEITHSNQKPLGISGKASIKNKNTFGGNEIFQLGIQGSFLNSVEFESDNRFFGAWEVGVDASYKLPRFSFPLTNNRFVTNEMSPKTSFTLGTSLQKNIGLDKQRFTGIIDFKWDTNSKKNHTIELLNAQYIRNLNISSFFNVYSSEYRKLLDIRTNYFPDVSLSQENALLFINNTLSDTDFENNQPEEYRIIQNVKKRYDIITEDVLVPAISYQFIYNTQKNYKDTNFSFYRLRLTSSGFLSSLLAKKPINDNPRKILGTNIAQYIKLDFEHKQHWSLNKHNTIAIRNNIGIAVPYGNSSSIPFSRSYFAGGPNDIRAWRIYELGPGDENSGLEFNVGNLKLLSSIEYRFDIISSFKGAFFIDAGNIWDISNSDLTTDGAKFNNFSSLKNIAIGSGIGIRYDFSFLVFRGDLGFKSYEPYNASGEKWFNTESLKKPIFNIGINYPF